MILYFFQKVPLGNPVIYFFRTDNFLKSGLQNLPNIYFPEIYLFFAFGKSLFDFFLWNLPFFTFSRDGLHHMEKGYLLIPVHFLRGRKLL